MNNTIKYLRQIADHMSKAADHLADAAHLQSMLHREPTPWRERLADDHGLDPCELADVEPMETIGDDAAIGDAGPMVVDAAVWREPVEPTGERHPNIGAALDRCRDVRESSSDPSLSWLAEVMRHAPPPEHCAPYCAFMRTAEGLAARSDEAKAVKVALADARREYDELVTAIAKRRSELEAAGVQS